MDYVPGTEFLVDEHRDTEIGNRTCLHRANVEQDIAFINCNTVFMAIQRFSLFLNLLSPILTIPFDGHHCGSGQPS